MQISAPYFPQEENYTCGPTVIKMISAFFGKEIDLEKVYKLTNPNPETGTSNSNLVRSAKSLGFSVYTQNCADIKEIRKFLIRGLPVVVNFIEPRGRQEGHYSLVVGMTETEIIFNDPGYGEGYRMGIPEFLSRWRSEFEPYQRWMMVVMLKRSYFSGFVSFAKERFFNRSSQVKAN